MTTITQTIDLLGDSPSEHGIRHEVSPKSILLPDKVLQNILSYSLSEYNKDNSKPSVFRHYNKSKICTQVSIELGKKQGIPPYEHLPPMLKLIIREVKNVLSRKQSNRVKTTHAVF